MKVYQQHDIEKSALNAKCENLKPAKNYYIKYIPFLKTLNYQKNPY